MSQEIGPGQNSCQFEHAPKRSNWAPTRYAHNEPDGNVCTVSRRFHTFQNVKADRAMIQSCQVPGHSSTET